MRVIFFERLTVSTNAILNYIKNKLPTFKFEISEMKGARADGCYDPTGIKYEGITVEYYFHPASGIIQADIDKSSPVRAWGNAITHGIVNKKPCTWIVLPDGVNPTPTQINTILAEMKKATEADQPLSTI